MKRKKEDIEYNNENIYKCIKLTNMYLDNIKNIKNEINIQNHIYNIKQRYEYYMDNMYEYSFFNIKNEIDLFFYLLTNNNSNKKLILKLIIKIDNYILKHIDIEHHNKKIKN